MERNLLSELTKWKERKNRKPLLLKGARQTGKTWLLEEFGRKEYKDVAYFNLDREPGIREIFEKNKNPIDIIRKLGYVIRKEIKEGETLLILDEIQASRAALNSLKYFKEEAPGYHVAAAGSLLGIYLSGLYTEDLKKGEELTVPVGSVDMLNLHPMTFSEFLKADDEILYSYFNSISKGTQIETIFHERLLEEYGRYLIVGGMPECVSSWIENHDFDEVSRIQDDLVEIYELDFAKYHGRISSDKILLVFRRMVSQLAKPNEKFIYGALKKGARAKEYEGAIEWLSSAGLVNRIYNVSKPEIPLTAYENLDAFKLYLFDTGLLKHMAGLDNSPILTKSDYQFKGPLTENYVLQQLKPVQKVNPVYYSTKNGEIDFLVQYGNEIIPLEVKGGEDKSAPSFKRYIREHTPVHAIRLSKRNYMENGEITNIPLYLAERINDLL